MTTATTKKYKRAWILFVILSIAANLCPIVVYSIKAIVSSNLVYEKVTLCTTVFIVIILTGVSMVNKVALRSRLWIILIGLYICLDQILEPLILIAACQILDELALNPLKKACKSRWVINKQLDRRL